MRLAGELSDPEVTSETIPQALRRLGKVRNGDITAIHQVTPKTESLSDCPNSHQHWAIRDQDSWTLILSSSSALPLVSCVALEKSLTFSKSPLTHPQRGDNYTFCCFTSRVCGGNLMGW